VTAVSSSPALSYMMPCVGIFQNTMGSMPGRPADSCTGQRSPLTRLSNVRAKPSRRCLNSEFFGTFENVGLFFIPEIFVQKNRSRLSIFGLVRRLCRALMHDRVARLTSLPAIRSAIR
jgi:hypothetical protein